MSRADATPLFIQYLKTGLSRGWPAMHANSLCNMEGLQQSKPMLPLAARGPWGRGAARQSPGGTSSRWEVVMTGGREVGWKRGCPGKVRVTA